MKTVDEILYNSETLDYLLAKKNKTIDDRIKEGYTVRVKMIFVIMLLIFLAVAIWLDILCVLQEDGPGLNGFIFTSIAPAFLYVFCKNTYHVHGKEILKKFFFFKVKTIEFSSIEKVVVRKDWIDGRHLMIYIKDSEKPVFDMDTSYLNTVLFEEDLKRRHIKISDKYKK